MKLNIDFIGNCAFGVTIISLFLLAFYLFYLIVSQYNSPKIEIPKAEFHCTDSHEEYKLVSVKPYMRRNVEICDQYTRLTK